MLLNDNEEKLQGVTYSITFLQEDNQQVITEGNQEEIMHFFSIYKFQLRTMIILVHSNSLKTPPEILHCYVVFS